MTTTDEARAEALEKDRQDWYVDHAEPGVASNAFERGWGACAVWQASRKVEVTEPQPLADEEAIFEYFDLNNLHVLPVLASDGEPYLIGTSEDGDMFAQGLPYEEGDGSTRLSNEGLGDKPEQWWPILPLAPVAAMLAALGGGDHAE